MASSIMFPASCATAMSLETVIGTKRSTHSIDRLSLKKRRKQSKPVRIASTEDSQSSEDSPHGATSNSSPNQLIVSGNFSINSDIKLAPLNLSKHVEAGGKIEETFGSDSDAEGLYKKQNISPLNNHLSHPNLALNLTSNVSMDGSQVKIFNPEAFCDLCNKEFCNKYFLKTHRANKHRVYLQSPSNISLETPASKTSVPVADFSAQNNMFLSKTWSGKKANNQSNGANSKSQHSRHHVKGINSMMRAFCNICRKEFCNKYFVRRHKAKIHGIADTTSEGSSTEGKNEPEFLPHPNESNHDSTNDSEVFLEKDDGSKNQWYTQNGQTKLSCSFCEEELIDGNALLKHLEEVHNNPDGEINTEENVLNLQMNPSSSKNTMTENPSVEPIDFAKRDECHHNFASPTVELPQSVQHQLSTSVSTFGSTLGQLLNHSNKLVQNHSSSKLMRNEENSRYETETPSPLNLVLNNNNNDVFLSSGSKITENCAICGDQFDSLYMFQIHMMKTHNISLTSKEPNVFDVRVKESSSPPGLRDRSPILVDKNKHAENIKKLHRMIMKMNYTETTSCDLCDTDFKSIYFLEYHILKTHRVLLEEVNTLIEEDCNLFNQSKTPKDCPDGMREESSPQQDNLQISSFCDICKKELCNKYFMKTHMQRMHGISIETGTHIGGVMCDICNKELCSKYFLRVHKQNSHGIVDDSLLPRLWVVDLLKNSPGKEKSVKTEDIVELPEKQSKTASEVCPKCNKRFRLAKWLKVHLCVEHGEGSTEILSTSPSESPSPHKTSVKIELNSTPSPILHSTSPPISNNCNSSNEQQNSTLDSETLEKSSETFQAFSNMLSGNISTTEKQEYLCSQCSFSTTTLAYLYVHERSHNQEKIMSFRCPFCSLGFDSKEAMTIHFSSHQTIHSIDIPSKLGETCWTAACDGSIFQNKFQGPDPDFSAMLSRVRDTLLMAAGKLNNSLSFAVPYSEDSFVMQPFFLESTPGEAVSGDSGDPFLSSLVFLPVREKLSRPVNLSFTLTPT